MIVDRVEVRDQRDRKPIPSGDAMIATEDDAFFPGFTPPDDQRRVGAHPVQIDRNVAGSGKSPIVTVRFLEQQRGPRVRPHAGTAQQQHEDPPHSKSHM